MSKKTKPITPPAGNPPPMRTDFTPEEIAWCVEHEKMRWRGVRSQEEDAKPRATLRPGLFVYDGWTELWGIVLAIQPDPATVVCLSADGEVWTQNDSFVDLPVKGGAIDRLCGNGLAAGIIGGFLPALNSAPDGAKENQTTPVDLRRLLAITTEARLMLEEASGTDDNKPLHVAVDGVELDGLESIDARDLEEIMEGFKDANDDAEMLLGRAMRQSMRQQYLRALRGGVA